jgi:hypothetical protein
MSSGSSSDLASSLFGGFGSARPAGGTPTGQQLNDWIEDVLVHDSEPFSSSSSSSSSSEEKKEEKKLKTLIVRETLTPSLKLEDVKGDEKEIKRPFLHNTLGSIDNKQNDAPQFSFHHKDFAVAKPLATFLHRPNSRHWNLSVSAPAVRGTHILVGADDTKSTESYLVCFSNAHQKSMPITDACPASEGSRYPTWISDTRVVACSTINGSLTTFAFDGHHLAQTHILRGVHTREVRELATCPVNPQLVASTGADALLCVTDLSAGTLLARTPLEGVGGSVKWKEDSIGVTLDNGRLLFYDARTSFLKPQLNYRPGHTSSLYTHDRYSPYYTLMGYGNGALQNLDLRTGKVTWQVEDFYVEGIGMIESRGNAFVTSGFSDFTVWKQNPLTGEANIWSHSLDGVNDFNEDVNLIYVATWLDHDTILATNSHGRIGIWTQGFDPLDAHFQ